MSTLGVFNDTLYNPVALLPTLLFATSTVASGTLLAAKMSGAQEVYVTQSAATALTTDTAANIIANLKVQIATTYSNAGLNADPSTINVIGSTYYLQVGNTNAGTLTLTAGTGVTITGTATIATVSSRQYMVTINSATAVTLQNLGGGAWT